MEHTILEAYRATLQQVASRLVMMAEAKKSILRPQTQSRFLAEKAKFTEKPKYIQLFARICEASANCSLSWTDDQAIYLEILRGLQPGEINRTPSELLISKFWTMQLYY